MDVSEVEEPQAPDLEEARTLVYNALASAMNGEGRFQRTLDEAKSMLNLLEAAVLEHHKASQPPKPSRFYATPAEVDTFLRLHFAEDVLRQYQWAIGDAAAEEAGQDVSTLLYASGDAEASELVNKAINPHYPAKLVEFTTSRNGTS